MKSFIAGSPMVTCLLVAAIVGGGMSAPVATSLPVKNAHQTSTLANPDSPVLPADPVIPSGSVSVSVYGATPNDGQDDRAAIQDALVDVSDSGGGTVEFDVGQYDITIDHNTSQPPYAGPIAIELPPKVRLKGATSGDTILRLANNQGEYRTIFATRPGMVTEDVVLEDLVVDSNSQNNQRSLRTVGTTNNTRRLMIASCRFTNQLNTHVIGSWGPDLQIVDSVFDNIGGGINDQDHSSIYTNNDRSLIANNTFTSMNGPGTTNASTAIETHNNDQTVVGNTIIGYSKGMNITGA